MNFKQSLNCNGLKRSFFNIESRGMLWITLDPAIFLIDNSVKLNLLNMLPGLPVSGGDLKVRITQKWVTFDLNNINAITNQDNLISFLEWALMLLKK